MPLVGTYFQRIIFCSLIIVCSFSLRSRTVIAMEFSGTEKVDACQDAPSRRFRHPSRLVVQLCRSQQASGVLVGHFLHFLDDEIVNRLLVRTGDVQPYDILGRFRLKRHVSPALYQVEIVERAQEPCFGYILGFQFRINIGNPVNIFQKDIGTVDARIQCVPESRHGGVAGGGGIAYQPFRGRSTSGTSIVGQIISTGKVHVIGSVECRLSQFRINTCQERTGLIRRIEIVWQRNLVRVLIQKVTRRQRTAKQQRENRIF